MIAVVSCGHNPDDERIYHREIKSLLKSGLEITYFTRYDGNMNMSNERLCHINFTRSGRSIRQYSKNVLAEIEKINPPDIIHVHEFELLPLAKKVKQRWQSRIIYDSHEAHLEMWDEFSSKTPLLKSLINKSLWKYETHYLKYVDLIFTVTEALVDRYSKFGVHASLIPNYPIMQGNEKTEKSFPNVVYHGQLSQERGLKDLVNAFPRVRDRIKESRLDLFGGERVSGFKSELQSLVNRLALSESVKIHDPIPHQQMIDKLSTYQVGVIPFRDNPFTQAGTASKLFEFMDNRVAVVATDLVPYRKFGEDGACLLVKPGNLSAFSEGIISILSDGTLRQKMTDKAYTLVRDRYNWGQVEPELIGLYKDILNE